MNPADASHTYLFIHIHTCTTYIHILKIIISIIVIYHLNYVKFFNYFTHTCSSTHLPVIVLFFATVSVSRGAKGKVFKYHQTIIPN